MGIRKFQAEIKCRKPREAVLARHGGLDIAGEADLRDIAPLGILDMEDGEWTDIQTDVIHKSQDESIKMPHLLFLLFRLCLCPASLPIQLLVPSGFFL